MLRQDFVRRQAEAYRDAKENVIPWQAYTWEVMKQWRDIDHPIQLVESVLSYLDPCMLRDDIRKGRAIKVWGGGKFSLSHPLTDFYNPPEDYVWPIRGYHISRALHDYNIHNRLRLSFSPADELYGALAARSDFSTLSQTAQWTDDVAMGCYYAHFGKWPEVQRPVVVKPDWNGLRDYLNGF